MTDRYHVHPLALRVLDANKEQRDPVEAANAQIEWEEASYPLLAPRASAVMRAVEEAMKRCPGDGCDNCVFATAAPTISTPSGYLPCPLIEIRATWEETALPEMLDINADVSHIGLYSKPPPSSTMPCEEEVSFPAATDQIGKVDGGGGRGDNSTVTFPRAPKEWGKVEAVVITSLEGELDPTEGDDAMNKIQFPLGHGYGIPIRTDDGTAVDLTGAKVTALIKYPPDERTHTRELELDDSAVMGLVHINLDRLGDWILQIRIEQGGNVWHTPVGLLTVVEDPADATIPEEAAPMGQRETVADSVAALLDSQGLTPRDKALYWLHDCSDFDPDRWACVRGDDCTPCPDARRCKLIMEAARPGSLGIKDAPMGVERVPEEVKRLQEECAALRVQVDLARLVAGVWDKHKWAIKETGSWDIVNQTIKQLVDTLKRGPRPGGDFIVVEGVVRQRDVPGLSLPMHHRFTRVKSPGGTDKWEELSEVPDGTRVQILAPRAGGE